MFEFVALVSNTAALIYFAALFSKLWAPRPAYYYKP